MHSRRDFIKKTAMSAVLAGGAASAAESAVAEDRCEQLAKELAIAMTQKTGCQWQVTVDSDFVLLSRKY